MDYRMRRLRNKALQSRKESSYYVSEVSPGLNKPEVGLGRRTLSGPQHELMTSYDVGITS